MKIFGAFACPAVWLAATLGPDGIVTGQVAVAAIIVSGAAYGLLHAFGRAMDCIYGPVGIDK